MTKKKALFSDFDGTLSDGYISMDFMDYLHKRDLYSNKCYDEQIELVDEYKKGDIGYDLWIERWAETWAEGLAGEKEIVIADAAENFYSGFRQNIYSSSHTMMEMLRIKGFDLVMVSVGAHEVASLAAAELSMDYAIATRCEIMDGIYTGNLATILHRPTGKADSLKIYMRQYGISALDSIAAGDSTHDASMLELVGFPIALNPQAELKELAENQGWEVRYHTDILDFVRGL